MASFRLSWKHIVSWLESPTWVMLIRLMRLTGTPVSSDTWFWTVGLSDGGSEVGDELRHLVPAVVFSSCGSCSVAVVRKACGWPTAMRPATTPATAGIMTSSHARLPSTFR